MKDKVVIYVHGKGGSVSESRTYEPLFAECDVTGLDYKTSTPRETGKEINDAVTKLKAEYESVILIANSVGAFFSMHAGIDGMLSEAYFISPVVDMEKLILGMMAHENVTEEELKEKKTVKTSFDEDLSYEYLLYVREHPVKWNVKTHIAYGEHDSFTDIETVKKFADNHSADLSVMKGGEHWFHTEEQMEFLFEWIRKSRRRNDD